MTKNPWSANEVADDLKKQLQKKVEVAGIEIIDTDHPPFLRSGDRRRDASAPAGTAIIAARKKIVEGAVGMVEMALEQLSEKGVVDLDEERKASMVSNLMVVLSSNQDAAGGQCGSIY